MMTVGIRHCWPVLDIPSECAWTVKRFLESEDYDYIEIPADLACPDFVKRFNEVRRSRGGVTITLFQSPIAHLRCPILISPGQETDRGGIATGYEIEWFGDGIEVIPPDNTSWWQHRLQHEHSVVERAFAAQWAHENKEESAINSGMGMLQDMMISTARHEKPAGFEVWLTHRERKICATLIQWLGTNCGRSFLYEVSRRAGRSRD